MYSSAMSQDKKKVRPTKPDSNNPLGSEGRGFFANMVIALGLFTVILIGYSSIVDYFGSDTQVPISQLAQQIASGTVSAIEITGSQLAISYTGTTTKAESTQEIGSSFVETMSSYGITPEMLTNVAITVKQQSNAGYWIVNLLPFGFTLLLIILIIWYLTRQMKGAGVQAFTFGQSKARMIPPSDKSQRVTFKDVAGAKEAKQELQEIVDFLRNPRKFFDIGAQIPKGIVLMGAPGTGKTLLARAVAGEAHVAFFSISGSEFVEMFVGVGASRVRDLFAMAKKAAPAIIFVDEIDAVGRVRGTGVGGGNDEREQTLNQILVEMDGFEPTEKVIVMAATNRPDVLDPALLRPGRFDRRVTIDLPDRSDREEILKVQARNKPLAEDVKLSVIAERTPGLSGADLYSLVNEAAILAARENRTKVAQYDLIRSIEKVMLGPERRSHVLSPKEKELTAYHEAGHAIVASVLKYADPVHKISIISRGRAAGYTLKLPLEDRRMQSRNEFLDDIAMSLGGYVVEEMVYGDLTTGPSNDLQVATSLARHMVTRFGMSVALGPIAFESDGGRALFGNSVSSEDTSPEVRAKIDAEVSKIMNEAYARAKDIVQKYRHVLDIVAKKLVEQETLEREEYEAIISAHGIPLKKIDPAEGKTGITITE